MPDANAHPADMFTVKGSTLPRFWWLRPWTTARTLAVTVDALRSYADRADAALKASQQDTLAAQQSRAHWIAKAERSYAVAMHNERVIIELEKKLHG